MKFDYKVGDCREIIPTLSNIQTVVTSPPYWGGIRDFDIEPTTWLDGWIGTLGNEQSPNDYSKHIADIFDLIMEVLKEKGTIWLNIGDSYNKDNELVGIPWMVAFELKQRNWRIIKDIIWYKPNPPPNNTIYRPTSSHEHIFLISKNKDYYYNADGVRIPHSINYLKRAKYPMCYHRDKKEEYNPSMRYPNSKGRVVRDVWTFVTSRPKEMHPAVYPIELPKVCIKLTTKVGDWVLDPFVGSGTTILAARELSRNAIGIDLNPEYKDRGVEKSMLNIPEIESYM